MSGGWLYGGKGDLFPDLSWTNRPSMDDSLASGSLRAADVCKAPNTGHGDPWYRTGQVCHIQKFRVFTSKVPGARQSPARSLAWW